MQCWLYRHSGNTMERSWMQKATIIWYVLKLSWEKFELESHEATPSCLWVHYVNDRLDTIRIKEKLYNITLICDHVSTECVLVYNKCEKRRREKRVFRGNMEREVGKARVCGSRGMQKPDFKRLFGLQLIVSRAVIFLPDMQNVKNFFFFFAVLLMLWWWLWH